MENTDRKTLVMKDGTTVRPLYIQNFSLDDWSLLEKIKTAHNMANIADALRFAVRKTSGAI